MTIVTDQIDSVRAGSPPETSWQQAMKTAIRDPVELCRHLQLPAELITSAQDAAELFSVLAPLGFVARMKLGDPHDPLLRQVLPIDSELHPAAGFSSDPVGDERAATAPGLIHKYHGRALLITTGACAIHCRYCFRRHFAYSDAPHSLNEWEPALAELAADSSVEEVLLSGGDPLTLTDSFLQELIGRIETIDHMRRVRIHTRLPIVIPARVTDRLIETLVDSRLTPVVVVHANHPAELDEDVDRALARLIDAGIPVLNQSVLLRGVNDQSDVLVELSRRLIDARVMPYYLHQLDRVVGAAHFEVPIETGKAILREMRAKLPGYAVPRYVQEIPGESGKRVLA